jgi:hypothetical protein
MYPSHIPPAVLLAVHSPALLLHCQLSSWQTADPSAPPFQLRLLVLLALLLLLLVVVLATVSAAAAAEPGRQGDLTLGWAAPQHAGLAAVGGGHHPTLRTSLMH